MKKNNSIILPTALEIANNNKRIITSQSSAKTGDIVKQTTNKQRMKYASAVVSTGQQDYYNPLFEESTLMMPTKLREINQYCRHYYRSDALVAAAINFHSEFAVNGFNNICEDKKVLNFFNELAFDVLDLPIFMSFLSLEWYKLGNAFPYGVWNEDDGRWDRFITLNPDYVEIEKILFSDTPQLKLDPDEGLKRIVQNKSPRHLYDQLDPIIKAYVSKNQKIPLSDLVIETEKGDIEFPQVTHIARKASQYEVYGIPLILPALKVLQYKDLLRRAQYAIGRRHWKPIKLVKVGDSEHEPTPEVLDDVIDAIQNADADSNSWMVWHHYITAEYIASAGHVLPLNAEYDYIDKELMRALEISDAVLTNQGMTFANASIALRVMINKYIRFQKLLSQFIQNFIYKPVAEVQGFYKTNDEGKKELIVPEVEWELTRLQDDAQLKSVYQAMQQRGLISKSTLMAYMGLEYEKERKQIQKEKEEEKDRGMTPEQQQLKDKMIPPGGVPKPPAGAPAGGGGGAGVGLPPIPTPTPGPGAEAPGAGAPPTLPVPEGIPGGGGT